MWRDDVGVVFLAKHPVVWGHLLVAPIEHREHVVGDSDHSEYLDCPMDEPPQNAMR